MIGERIKRARKMRGWSLRELAGRAGLSAQAISKYERGLDKPGSDALIALSRELDVRLEYFLRGGGPVSVTPAFRKLARLRRKAEDAVVARVEDWLERYLEIEDILMLGDVPVGLPEGFPMRVRRVEEAEDAAEKLRTAWGLGVETIPDLVEVLEDRGLKVGVIEGPEEFDACAFWADGSAVMAVRNGVPGDRQRYNLAHELGHLVTECAEDVDEEKVAHRFAGAFLVPADAARRELGARRHELDPFELHLLKHKYGLSVQAWIYRARDLGILSSSRSTSLFKLFRKRGWHREEPGDAVEAEDPTRFVRLVLHALAEDIISERRAEEILAEPLDRFFAEAAEEHGEEWRRYWSRTRTS